MKLLDYFPINHNGRTSISDPFGYISRLRDEGCCWLETLRDGSESKSATRMLYGLYVELIPTKSITRATKSHEMCSVETRKQLV